MNQSELSDTSNFEIVHCLIAVTNLKGNGPPLANVVPLAGTT